MSVDLNSDLGESFGRWRLGDDAAMLEIISSANVACGFHAGDPRTLDRTCAEAVRLGVAIGAQVSYPDLAGFGRRYLDVEPADLVADTIYQIGALDGLARANGGAVSYVKPHGALYNAVVSSPVQAAAVVEGVRRYDTRLPILCLPGSELLLAADRAGLRPVREAFADRAYTPAGTLLPRDRPGAVLSEPADISARIGQFVSSGTIRAIDGSDIRVEADSICVHGDTPGAVAIARAVREALAAAGIPVRPFSAGPRRTEAPH